MRFMPRRPHKGFRPVTQRRIKIYLGKMSTNIYTNKYVQPWEAEIPGLAETATGLRLPRYGEFWTDVIKRNRQLIGEKATKEQNALFPIDSYPLLYEMIIVFKPAKLCYSVSLCWRSSTEIQLFPRFQCVYGFSRVCVFPSQQYERTYGTGENMTGNKYYGHQRVL